MFSALPAVPHSMAWRLQAFRVCFRHAARRLIGMLLFLFLSLVVSQAPVRAGERPLESVRLQLKWTHQFQFAGYYAAVAQGYFREAGLEVELLPAKPGLKPSDLLLSGQVQYAVMSPAVLIERQQGRPLVVLGAIFQHSGTVIMTKKEAGLTTPQDLKGKRLMLTADSDPENQAMLINSGVPLETLTIVTHSWDLDDLISGRVDAQTGYLTNEPYLLRQRGVEPALLKPMQYGIDFYGDCLVTTEAELRAHPKRTEAFFRAVQRGWQYAMAHPEEMAQLIVDRYSREKTVEHLLFEANMIRSLIQPELFGIGYMNPERWRLIADTYAQLGMMPPGYSLDGFLYPQIQEQLAFGRQRLIRLALYVLAGVLLAGMGVGVLLLFFNARLAHEVQKRTAALAASERSFRAFFELASVGVAQVDARTGRFLRINRKYCDIVGYSEQEMLERSFRDITYPEDILLDRQQRRDLMAGRIPEFTVEKRYIHKNGSIVWVLISVSPLWSGDQERRHNLAVIRDITKRKQAEEELVFAAKVFDNSIEGIVVTDADATILQVNPAFTVITGYGPAEAIGQNPRMLKSDKHLPAFYQAMWNQLAREGQWAGELWNRRKNGEVYPEWLTISAISNPLGRVTHYIGLFHDITELKRQQEALEHQAQHDALTNLPNRVLLNDRLAMALARMKRKSVKAALLFLDLDHFKNINDGFGHVAGDNLLVELSRRLKEQLRIGDTLARQGGDEFLILLPEVDSVDDVGLVALRLLNSLRQPFHHQDIEYFIGASIGVTIAPDDGTDADTLIKNADMAMYRAKQLGRNNYQFFTPELDAQAHRRISLESKLRRGIEQGELELHFQPVVSSGSGKIHGAEALVRWRHEGELIAPGEFIPLAEESGLILPLGEWVLRTAAGRARAWQDAGYRLGLSINLSSRQFTDQELVKLYLAVLADTGLEPGRLYFEITESLLMKEIDRAQHILGALRDIGGKFYLDDFGTGYSSLAYLKRLPLDGLKIDRSFIRDIESDADSRAIVEAIVSLAQTLHLAIVAEGVETTEQLGFLQGMGPMLIQGYLASPPVPAERFDALLRQGDSLLPPSTTANANGPAPRYP